MSQPSNGQYGSISQDQSQQPLPPAPAPSAQFTTTGYSYPEKNPTGEFYNNNAGIGSTAYNYPSAVGGSTNHPGVVGATPVAMQDPTLPRPNDILPLHPAIIQQRQIAASLPPCPKGGYHELRTHHALGMNLGTIMSVICFPIVCCCVRDETVCIKCHEKFNFALPAIH
ncbi:hypothetical protein BGZ73_000921 [Actinomortierella ambigua]|nr:hypothetical protein BGZ73_000921 [Actinomortierella ambigua]